LLGLSDPENFTLKRILAFLLPVLGYTFILGAVLQFLVDPDTPDRRSRTLRMLSYVAGFQLNVAVLVVLGAALLELWNLLDWVQSVIYAVFFFGGIVLMFATPVLIITRYFEATLRASLRQRFPTSIGWLAYLLPFIIFVLPLLFLIESGIFGSLISVPNSERFACLVRQIEKKNGSRIDMTVELLNNQNRPIFFTPDEGVLYIKNAEPEAVYVRVVEWSDGKSPVLVLKKDEAKWLRVVSDVNVLLPEIPAFSKQDRQAASLKLSVYDTDQEQLVWKKCWL
jgi:hypothetical protein